MVRIVYSSGISRFMEHRIQIMKEAFIMGAFFYLPNGR